MPSLTSLLQGKQTRKLPMTATRVVRDGALVRLYYHSTPVLTEDSDGNTTVRAAQWRTPTTKRRINEYAPHGWRVFQRDRQWFWCRVTEAGRTEMPFNEYDIIGADGTLNPQLPNFNAA